MPTQNAVIAVASIFVVAAIVAGGIALTHHSKTEDDSPPPTQAGLTMLLGEMTLSQSKESDQRNFIQAELIAARDKLSSTLKNLSAYKKDPQALQVCKRVLDSSIDYLQKALDELGAGETAKKIHQHMNELRSRLSSSYTNVETCISALRRYNNAEESRDELEVSLGSAKERLSNALDHFVSADLSITSRQLLPKP